MTRTEDMIDAEDMKRIESRWKSDMDLKVDRIDRRVAIIERLVWIAVGGTCIIASITLIGVNIVIKQGEKLDGVAMRQAAAIAERVANEAHSKLRDSDLQTQIDRLRNGEKR